MQTAAILWHVSLLVPDDSRALALGLVGLVRVVPILLFSLVSGVAADALDRRRLMLVTQSMMAVLAAVLAVVDLSRADAVWPVYVLAAAAPRRRVRSAGAPVARCRHLVPRDHLPNAISLNTIVFQVAAVVGPALGGSLIAQHGVGWVYAQRGVVPRRHRRAAADDGRGLRSSAAPGRPPRRPSASRRPLEGLRFVFRAPLIRSTMLLDFFATFFSSATALLPIFAQDVLQVGARGYGWLYAAPAVGAVADERASWSARSTWIERRGQVLIGAVLVYGAATVAFGLSTSFWLTFWCLAITGAADTVSTVFRNLIRQLETPDALRGRMTGVNMVFFNGGPQLGELEAGLVAHWVGPVVSVVSGGIGCLAATTWVAARTPALRAVHRHEASQPRLRIRRHHERARSGADAGRPAVVRRATSHERQAMAGPAEARRVLNARRRGSVVRRQPAIIPVRRGKTQGRRPVRSVGRPEDADAGASGDKAPLTRTLDKKEVEDEVADTLGKLGHDATLHCPRRIDEEPARARELDCDLIFNLAESFAGNDTADYCIAAYLELVGKKITGSGSHGLLYAQDKAVAKKILEFHGIHTPVFAQVVPRPARFLARPRVSRHRQAGARGRLDRHRVQRRRRRRSAS